VAHLLIDGSLPGDYATCILNFSTSYPVTSDITIPAGTKCYAILPDGTKVYYITTEAGTVLTGESQAAIAARAVNRRIEGNIGPYKIPGRDPRIG